MSQPLFQGTPGGAELQRRLMGARSKLNELHTLIAFGIACVLGLAAASWCVFAVGLVVALGIKLHSGAIRFSKRK
jgi:hypothetical protein